MIHLSENFFRIDPSLAVTVSQDRIVCKALDANPHGVLWGSGAQLYFCRGSVQSAGVGTLNTK